MPRQEESVQLTWVGLHKCSNSSLFPSFIISKLFVQCSKSMILNDWNWYKRDNQGQGLQRVFKVGHIFQSSFFLSLCYKTNWQEGALPQEGGGGRFCSFVNLNTTLNSFLYGGGGGWGTTKILV